MSLNELRLFASDHGFNAPYVRDGVAIIVEERTFGRHGCRVAVDDQRVTSAEYNYAD